MTQRTGRMRTRWAKPGMGGTEQSFWDKVEIRSPVECWEWTAAHSNGKFCYGNFQTDAIKGRVSTERAHRVAYRFFHGRIDASRMICHSCDNPLCVNPLHLFEGTRQDNMDDMVAKGRSHGWRGDWTHCPMGHLYSGDNLYVKPDGRRRCRTCSRARERIRERAERKAKAQKDGPGA